MKLKKKKRERNSKKKKEDIKFKLALYSPVKNEKRLKEWIIYYKNLEIDLFIIKDDFSEISPKVYFEELNITNYEIIEGCEPYWNSITLRSSVKSYARTKIFDDHIIPLCKKHNIDYLLQFDSDEFLYLNYFKNIQEMLNHYQPFDELNINWLIFYDNCLKENKTNSLIKSSNLSGKYLNRYTKSITKVSSIITGRNAHNCLIKKNSVIKNIWNQIIPSLENKCGFFKKKNSVIKNIWNQIIPSLENKCGFFKNFSYNKAPIFIAHYVFKDIKNYVERKLCADDGNFNLIFNKYYDSDPKTIEEKQKLIKYHKENKNDLIDYIYYLRNGDVMNIKKQEDKHKLFEKNKEFYKRYYTSYGHDFENKLPNKEYYYTENILLINFFYNNNLFLL